MISPLLFVEDDIRFAFLAGEIVNVIIEATDPEAAGQIKEAGIQVVILGMEVNSTVSPFLCFRHAGVHQGFADALSPGIRTNFQIV